MASKGIRKINLSVDTLKELREYAWRHRVSISQVVRDILSAANDSPDKELIALYGDDNIHGNSATVTVYIPDEQWLPVKEKAYWARVSLSSIIRVGIRNTLDREEHAA